MLKLKNIKLNNNILSSKFYPENSEDFGTVSINIETMEVIEKTPSKYDETFPIYLNHAIEGLKKIIGTTELPKEKLVMWY